MQCRKAPRLLPSSHLHELAATKKNDLLVFCKHHHTWNQLVQRHSTKGIVPTRDACIISIAVCLESGTVVATDAHTILLALPRIPKFKRQLGCLRSCCSHEAMLFAQSWPSKEWPIVKMLPNVMSPTINFFCPSVNTL